MVKLTLSGMPEKCFPMVLSDSECETIIVIPIRYCRESTLITNGFKQFVFIQSVNRGVVFGSFNQAFFINTATLNPARGLRLGRIREQVNHPCYQQENQ